MMFVPGNNPGMMQDAFIYGPDSIMLDLEDSVTMAEKDAARLLVHNALKSIDYGDTEMVVRINPLSTPYGRKDVEAIVKAGVQVIRMPKTETADEVRELEAEIEKVEKELGCLGRTRMMAAIESAEGICNAFAIAKASKRMMGIALGAEDYCANLKTQRTPGGAELLYARETIGEIDGALSPDDDRTVNHLAVDGDDARAAFLGLLDGGENLLSLLDGLLGRGEHLVHDLDLTRVDDGLAVESESLDELDLLAESLHVIEV